MEIADRQIKFRGKRKDIGVWVYGNLIVTRSNRCYILEKEYETECSEPEYNHVAMGCGLEDNGITDRYDAMLYGWNEAICRYKDNLPDYIEVISETVGQLTTFCDQKGNEIYRDDIIKYNRYGQTKESPVVWDNSTATYWVDDETLPDLLFKQQKKMEEWNFGKGIYEIVGNIHDNKLAKTYGTE
jgi:hypothetical protein